MKKIYFPNLNGVRFFAALSVMIYHYWGVSVLNGHLGVILFFVLSGFLISFLLFKEKEENKSISIKQFYIRRILRIWPLYFLITIIASAWYLATTHNTAYFAEVIPYYLLFVPNLAFVLGKSFEYIGVLWSVGSEEQFYAAWPWLIERAKRKTTLYVFFLVVGFFMCAPHAVDYINHRYLHDNSVLFYSTKFMQRMSFGSMATGGIMAYLSIYKPSYLEPLFNRYVQVLTLFTLLWCWGRNVEFFFNDQVYATLFGILIVNFALNPKVIISLENRVFNYLGKISYGLYMYHLIAMGITRPWMQGVAGFVVFALMTICISAVSYRLFEEPFLRMKSRKFTVIQTI